MPIVDDINQLKQRIRDAKQQFRKSEDNSQSIFNPELGLTYAVPLDAVEQALLEFEAAHSELWIPGAIPVPITPHDARIRA